MWRAHDNSEPRRPIALLLNVLSTGGAQRRIATLANGFAALGRAVDVLCPELDGPMRISLAPAVRIVRVGGARALRAYIDAARPAVLMSCVTDTHGMAAKALAMPGLRVPLVLRASRHPCRSVPTWQIAARLAERFNRCKAARRYARADAIVALSDHGAATLAALIGRRAKRIETIPNPVIARTWLDEGKPRPLRSDSPVVLGIGRLTRQKDFATLLRAFALVHAERPCRLTLLGEGEERASLAALAAQLGVADAVTMPGEVGDVAARLAAADLLVSSSLWEGMQAVLIEALAAGCPVVATDCPGGAREVLQDGRLGPLVPVRAPAAMARAMCEQLDRPTSSEALARGAERFKEQGKAERYLALFDDLQPRSDAPWSPHFGRGNKPGSHAV